MATRPWRSPSDKIMVHSLLLLLVLLLLLLHRWASLRSGRSRWRGDHGWRRGKDVHRRRRGRGHRGWGHGDGGVATEPTRTSLPSWILEFCRWRRRPAFIFLRSRKRSIAGKHEILSDGLFIEEDDVDKEVMTGNPSVAALTLPPSHWWR
jgi:hypothetical protein